MSKFFGFIKTVGKEAKHIGYYTPKLYKLNYWKWGLHVFGIQYLFDRLKGEQIWWTDDEESYEAAIKKLRELRETHDFKFFYYEDRFEERVS